jgi:hypothetical protein
VAVAVGDLVAVPVGVGVFVCVIVGVGVGVFVGVLVTAGVFVGVFVGFFVAVGVLVGFFVAVGVFVGFFVAVGVFPLAAAALKTPSGGIPPVSVRHSAMPTIRTLAIMRDIPVITVPRLLQPAVLPIPFYHVSVLRTEMSGSACPRILIRSGG